MRGPDSLADAWSVAQPSERRRSHPLDLEGSERLGTQRPPENWRRLSVASPVSPRGSSRSDLGPAAFRGSVGSPSASPRDWDSTPASPGSQSPSSSLLSSPSSVGPARRPPAPGYSSSTDGSLARAYATVAEASPPRLAQMAALLEGDRAWARSQTQRYREKSPSVSRRPPRKLNRGSSAIERPTAVAFAASPSVASKAGPPPSRAEAEIKDLREQLAEERERVVSLAERKAVLAQELKRVRLEREDLGQDHGRLVARLAEVECEMASLQDRYETEILALRKTLAADALTSSPGSQHLALVEQIQGLTRANEELHEKLVDAMRTARVAFTKKDEAEKQATLFEKDLQQLREDTDSRAKAWEAERRKLEEMLLDSRVEAERRMEAMQSLEREMKGERQKREDAQLELQGKLGALEAQLVGQGLDLSTGKDGAVKKFSLLPGKGGVQGDQANQLEAEVSRLRSVVALKEMEVQKERAWREQVEAERRETKEALDVQSELVKEKIKALQREKEAALMAGERRVSTMQREIAILVDQKEAQDDATKKAKTCVEKAEQYLKALDVARVEVKRLRLERDLLSEKIRVLEQSVGKPGGVDVSWLLPDCLTKRGLDSAQVTPIGSMPPTPQSVSAK